MSHLRRRLGALVRGVTAHPFVVVGGVAALVAVGQAVWISEHRLPGALDPDEAGYLANALRFHHLLTTDPLALPRAVAGAGTGPLVPLLSVPLLLVGPDDPRTAMLVLPLLVVASSLCVAGIAHRLAGGEAALVAGLIWLVAPTVVFAGQTYWLGLGAATAAAAGCWALLASDRLANRWTWAYGVAMAAMALSRTMALGFVPALALAGLVVAGRNRAALRRLVLAWGLALVLAAPWYLVARESVFGYLLSYGYDERAALFGGGGGPLDRLQFRLEELGEGLGLGAHPLVAVAVAVAVGAALVVVARGRGGRVWRRGTAAVVSALVAGVAALASTSNRGVWFDLPMVALAAALGAALLQLAPSPVRAAVVGVVVVAGVGQLASAWWIVGPDAEVPLVADRWRVAQYEPGFAEYDPRFATDRRAEHRLAAADWWAVSDAVQDHLRGEAGDRKTLVTVSGNFEMFNANTLVLASVLDGWTPRVELPDTVDVDERGWDDLLGGGDPAGPASQRVLVVALHDHHLFTADAGVAELHRRAVAGGWEETWSTPLPGGGRVAVLAQPEGRS